MTFVTRASAFLLATLLLASGALAQTGPGLLIRPMPEGKFIETLTWATVLADGETDNDDNDFQLSLYETYGRITERPEQFIPRIGYELKYYDLDTTEPLLPGRLVDGSVAAGFKLPEIQGFVGGLTVGVGYAGDTPFADANAWYGKSTVIFGKKLNEREELAFALDYDGNRSFMPDVPLPGVFYRRRVYDTTLLALGFPFTSLEWTPNDKFRADVIYYFPERFDLRLSYAFTKGWSVFGLLEQRTDSFHLDELDAGDSHDRLIFTQKRAEAGLRWQPSKDVSVSVAGGYAFGQEFNVGFDSRDMDELAEPSDEPYVRAGVEARF